MLNSQDANQRFFDPYYAAKPRLSLGHRAARAFRRPFYKALGSSRQAYRDSLLTDCHRAHCLELGIGIDNLAIELTQRGADVTVIDIAPEAINRARECFARLALGRHIYAFVQDAESLQFPPGSFDLIYGKWILHHLDTRKVLRELSRCLKPTGRAVFLEPLGVNPIINLFRRLTPHLRVPGEHPLTDTELAMFASRFAEVRVDYHHLLPLPYIPQAFMRRCEQALLCRMPSVGIYAWQAVITMLRPLKSHC